MLVAAVFPVGIRGTIVAGLHFRLVIFLVSAIVMIVFNAMILAAYLYFTG